MKWALAPRPKGLLILSAAIALGAPASARQAGNGSAVAPQIAPSEKTDVEQVRPTEIDRGKSTDTVQQVTTTEKQPTRMAQLPPDAELSPSAVGPEEGLEATTRPSPRADLYREVASVWELIRKRGQQPTPELIAREIGPDNLAKFLTDFPGSANMFGVDSDSLPVAPPPPPRQK